MFYYFILIFEKVGVKESRVVFCVVGVVSVIMIGVIVSIICFDSFRMFGVIFRFIFWLDNEFC